MSVAKKKVRSIRKSLVARKVLMAAWQAQRKQRLLLKRVVNLIPNFLPDPLIVKAAWSKRARAAWSLRRVALPAVTAVRHAVLLKEGCTDMAGCGSKKYAKGGMVSGKCGGSVMKAKGGMVSKVKPKGDGC